MSEIFEAEVIPVPLTTIFSVEAPVAVKATFPVIGPGTVGEKRTYTVTGEPSKEPAVCVRVIEEENEVLSALTSKPTGAETDTEVDKPVAVTVKD